MRLSWARPRPPAAAVPDRIRIRELGETDGPALGQLMWAAFHGTIDDQYATASDAAADAAGTLDGKWGPVLWQASLAAEVGPAIAAAVIVVEDNAHGYQPLLAFAMTHPVWQRRGIGQRLIEESVARLDAQGLRELHLAVTRDNPAIRLYQRLGFQIIPAEGNR